jgi:hypothetical protein
MILHILKLKEKPWGATSLDSNVFPREICCLCIIAGMPKGLHLLLGGNFEAFIKFAGNLILNFRRRRPRQEFLLRSRQAAAVAVAGINNSLL